ncbi:alpha/beta fold hydrolase [Pseudonocardia sp.]|jgi:pimeloyl-ACP methyl ester carboxylesterase|uniref:alpha/beta fold hydrolase n=1 Tax=Pseudonocardia sp. TaxID=60912 RepID=UPI003D0DC88A
MPHAERHTTPGKAGELSYLAWPGDPGATPILYLHPVNTAAAVWSAVAGELGDARAAIAVDYRAHGYSAPGGPYLPADYASDALAVLDAVGLERAHVVCGSIGGAVATELALAAPGRVASVAAFGATLRVGWDEATIDDTERDLRALGVREWFRRHGAGILGPASRPGAAAELVELAAGGPDGDRPLDTVVEVLRTTFVVADSRPAGAALAARAERVPARVFVGTHDPTCPEAMAHELAAAFGGDVRTMTGIGHLPMLEDPAGTAAGIRDFHDRLTGDGS